MTEDEVRVQRYYGERPLLSRIEASLRTAGVDPLKPGHRDLWAFDQMHSRGIAATQEHAGRARIKAGMYVLDLGCGIGGVSRYLAAECGCRVAAVDLTPGFVELAGILNEHCGLADQIAVQCANALALPFADGVFDHVLSYAMTMNVPDKQTFAHQVARVLKPGGLFSCNEVAQGPAGTPIFPLPWATDESSSFLTTPAEMRAALESGGLTMLEQIDLTPIPVEQARPNAVRTDDFPVRQANLQRCLENRTLLGQFILAQKGA